MKLTPLDIRHREFRRAMRGYADEEVDLFLDEVADEFERLYRENIETMERVERLEEQVAQFDQLKETLQHTLITAQQQADDVKANARKEAELMLRDAELKGRDIMADSYVEKQRVEQALIQLRQVEEDFRFKFRSLLEAHLNLLTEDETSEDRRRFRGIVSEVEGERTHAEPEGPAVESGMAEAGIVEPEDGRPGTGEPAAVQVADDASPENVPAGSLAQGEGAGGPAARGAQAALVWDVAVATDDTATDEKAMPPAVADAVQAAKEAGGLGDAGSAGDRADAAGDSLAGRETRDFEW